MLDLAKKHKKQVRTISLGQGQEPAARKLISTGVAQGSWVMLQNCHLGLKFMAEVETTMLKLDDIEPGFQLWITTEPHPKFPIGLLQMSIKVTNEAPAGVRAGLKSSYAWVNQDMLDAVTQPQWKSMLYALCFMHTIVQERRKFGPLGFNIPYEFNQSDLGACVMFMQSHLHDMDTKKRPVDWECVNYMVCEVQYGGKITDGAHPRGSSPAPTLPRLAPLAPRTAPHRRPALRPLTRPRSPRRRRLGPAALQHVRPGVARASHPRPAVQVPRGVPDPAGGRGGRLPQGH